MSYANHSCFYINEAVLTLGVRLKRYHTASVKTSTRKTMSTRSATHCRKDSVHRLPNV